jgi:glycosyltransferase involved in cell wall biosynthesis
MPVRIKAAPAQPFGFPAPPPGWVQKPAGISLCMIVRDEEAMLEQCLQSVKDAVDEIIVVDTGSQDRTVEIAQKFGARIEHREWRNDFAWARNESIQLARYRWILQLDADEVLLPESKPALSQLRNARAYLTGGWVRCVNFADQYLGGEGTISHMIVRIFPNTDRIRFYGVIHEFPSMDGSASTLAAVYTPVKIEHHGYTSDMMRDRGKFDRNMAIIEAAVERDPNEEFNWYNLGMTAYIGGDYARGADAMRRMWELAKKHGMRGFVPNGLTVLADALTDYLGAPEEALLYAQEALKLAPRYANAHFSAGRALETLKRYDEAREMYEAAIADGAHLERQFIVDEDVPRWKAQNMIGGTYVAQQNDAAALPWFEAGLKNTPNVQPLRINYASSLERLGRVNEAEAIFRSLCEDLGDEQSVLQYVNFLLRHKPLAALPVIEARHRSCSAEIAVAQLLAAAALSQRHGLGDGERYLLAALERAPGSAEVLGPLELIYRDRGDAVALARLRAQEAQTEPKTASDFARRAQIAASENDFERALALAQAGLERTPGDAMLHYTAGVACARLARKEDAISHLENAAGLADDVQLEAALMRGSLLESLGRMDEAEAALRCALPLAKRRAATELGAFYLRAGRYAEAQRVAEEALA